MFTTGVLQKSEYLAKLFNTMGVAEIENTVYIHVHVYFNAHVQLSHAQCHLKFSPASTSPLAISIQILLAATHSSSSISL